MRNLLIFVAIIFVFYLLGFVFKDKNFKADYEFMSFTHSNSYRAVAALIIMLQHVAGGFGVRYFTPLGGIGVAVFLISSGYGLNESYKRYGVCGGGYWQPKIIRVLIPYLIVISACLAYAIVSKNEFEFPYYWYLDFMFLWYLVFYAVIKIPGAYEKKYWILGVTSLAVFLLGNGIRAEQAVSFLVGVLISDHYVEAKKRIVDYRYILVLSMIGILLLGLKQFPLLRSIEDSLIWYGLQLMMKMALAIAILGLTQRLQVLMNNKMILMVGGISYEFYLIHYRLLHLPVMGIGGMMIFLIVTVVASKAINWVTKKAKTCI